jgi:hypothetical protein
MFLRDQMMFSDECHTEWWRVAPYDHVTSVDGLDSFMYGA